MHGDPKSFPCKAAYKYIAKYSVPSVLDVPLT